MFEIQKITSELVSEEELETTKAAMAGSFARSLESPQTIAGFALSIEKYGLDKSYYQDYLKNPEVAQENFKKAPECHSY